MRVGLMAHASAHVQTPVAKHRTALSLTEY